MGLDSSILGRGLELWRYVIRPPRFPWSNPMTDWDGILSTFNPTLGGKMACQYGENPYRHPPNSNTENMSWLDPPNLYPSNTKPQYSPLDVYRVYWKNRRWKEWVSGIWVKQKIVSSHTSSDDVMPVFEGWFFGGHWFIIILVKHDSDMFLQLVNSCVSHFLWDSKPHKNTVDPIQCAKRQLRVHLEFSHPLGNMFSS